jgi:hypothetical protein
MRFLGSVVVKSAVEAGAVSVIIQNVVAVELDLVFTPSWGSTLGPLTGLPEFRNC